MTAAFRQEPFHDPDTDRIRIIRQGGPRADQAFRELMDSHALSIQRRAYRILRSEADAEEIVQEVFLSVLRSIDRYRPERPFSHWLSVVTLNACRLKLRRRKGRDRRHDAFRSGVLNEAAPISPDPILRRSLKRALSTLREPTRTSVLLRVVEEMSYREVAQSQNSSVPAAKMRVARGLHALRSNPEIASRLR